VIIVLNTINETTDMKCLDSVTPESLVLIMWVDSVLEILFLGTALAIVILVFEISRHMSTGIFRRFFLFLKLTAIVILINRIYTDIVNPTPLFNLSSSPTLFFNPLMADYAFRVIWSTLFMLSLAFLYLDWRSTSLDQPIKPRSTTKVEG